MPEISKTSQRRGRPDNSSSGESASATASVAPLVKITAAGSAPTSAAIAADRWVTDGNKSATRARAARPSAWIEEALPVSAKAAAIAARASGRSGEVALWSR